MDTRQSFLNKGRQDKFRLVFDVPPILKPMVRKLEQSSNTIIPDTVQFSVYGTTVPEITVKGVEARFAGSTLYQSSFSKDSYPPINIKFNIDSQYQNYWVIFSWLNLLHDQKTGVYNQGNIPVDGNFNDYQVDMTLYALDEFGNDVMKFTYTKAFVTQLESITYDQQTDEGVELKCGFTFLFSQLHMEIVNVIS